MNRSYLRITADHIATNLLTALADGQPSAAERMGSPLEKWSDELESQLLTGKMKFRQDDPTITSAALRDAANKLHLAILTEVATDFVGSWGDDEAAADTAANEATWAAANSLSSTTTAVDALDLWRLASLLRATGLFIRWNAQVLQSPYAPVSSPLDLSTNHMTRLKFKSMLLLYAKLMDIEIIISETTDSYPDVQRFASICLFRATYGKDIMTTTARRLFVNSLDGCSYLMRALLKGDQPVARLFSVVRNIHHLISACPESIPKMEEAVKTLTAGTKQYSLLEALVSTLAWAFRSKGFPGVASDRRSDLVLEILRSLYALDDPSGFRLANNDTTMTQIGIILCELLRLPSSDERVYEIKLAVVSLLLNAPKEYAQYLVKTGSIKPLVDIMSYQTSLVVVERTGSSAEDAAAVVPILLVLLKLAQANASALKIVKDEVFPPDAEEAFQLKATAEIAKGETEGKASAKNMAPLDAPKGTLRWKLIRLMTWTESNVKRAACELLWTLCDEDATQFVLRTGFGNAIHFLGIRGMVNLPAGVET